jgi:hypothetical protein
MRSGVMAHFRVPLRLSRFESLPATGWVGNTSQCPCQTVPKLAHSFVLDHRILLELRGSQVHTNLWSENY